MKGIYGNEHTESIRVMHMRSFVSNSFQPQWTVAHQTPLSMEFSRQEYWSRLPFTSQGDLPDPGIEPKSLEFPALPGRFFTIAPSGKPQNVYIFTYDLVSYPQIAHIQKNVTPLGENICERCI